MIDIIGTPNWNTFQLMHNGLRALHQNVPFLFPGSKVFGRALPKGENALHWTLQEKRDQFQAKKLLAFELCIPPYFSTSTRSFFLNFKILICDKMQADSAVVVLLGSLWTS